MGSVGFSKVDAPEDRQARHGPRPDSRLHPRSRHSPAAQALRSLDFSHRAEGIRLGELRHLCWNQLNLKRKQIRLNPGETKNKEGSVLPVYGEMRHWLEMPKSITDTKYRAGPYVFHHNGNLIVDFRKAWRSATKRAGLVGVLFHELRRSAVRNMREAGIPENIAMEISGHKTRSVFQRYNIVFDKDLKMAAEKMKDRFTENLKSLSKAEKEVARRVE